MKFVIGLNHKYGKSYYNEETEQMGTVTFATRYEKKPDTIPYLMKLQYISQKMSYDGVRYDSVFVEELNG